ncbi:hypothetical protein Pelo_1116 [Pelomyxa schiedti]|nr:hypothetical protein Pelo_1116 [Pelomyxa schiedti]
MCWEWPNDANTFDCIAPVWKKCGVDIVVLEERYHGTCAPNTHKVFSVEGADELKVALEMKYSLMQCMVEPGG